jgi:hypothetical protein
MLTTYESYKAYFQQLADEHIDINSFIFGGGIRIASRRNSSIEYPALWLATPDVVKKPNDLQQFSTLIMILKGVPPDFDEEDLANEEMKVIADDIILRLRHDAQQGMFNFGRTDTVLQPKFRQGSDNDTGWAIDFDITLGDDACYDPSKFGR